MIGKHCEYASYVLRHKFWVLVACLRYPWRPWDLIWRGLTHDWHKFLPSEWFPYVENFYGAGKGLRGDDLPSQLTLAYDDAWLRHQHRGDHHWQWWILRMDDGSDKVLPMSLMARVEMICDWYGASRAQGYGGWQSVQAWYEKNKGNMRLAPSTREVVEALLVRLAELETMEG